MLFARDEVIKTPHVDAFHPQGTIINKTEYRCSWGESGFFDQTISNAGFSDQESVDKSGLSLNFSTVNRKRTDILGHLIY